MLNHKAIKDLRSKHLGPSLRLSYDNPLHIVRGDAQYLFDVKGNRYLDCVNNIQHVGHCHPKIVEAAQSQYKKLNTNTRYLDEAIVNYARNLTQTLPDGLDVCFFTNSGSEANDLAMRIARNYEQSKETIVLDGAYHGNLSSLIEISPYKHNGPGGSGTPDYVHVIPMPDPFRGQYRGERCAEQYAKEVQEAIVRIQGRNRNSFAFISEALMGCGGQLILPEGFLQKAFELVKKAGGLCIADAFNNGMEYFNLFGGNPVSCAVGQAVLNVIRDEGLQAHAEHVGNYLLQKLHSLQNDHDIIGDVRGRGLFIGIELVRDYQLTPAANEAHTIVNSMKEKGVLLSTDGPDHNVIKIKPPMVFSKDNAHELVSKIDETIAEL